MRATELEGCKPMSNRRDLLSIGNAILDIVGRCDEAQLGALGLSKGHMRLVPSTAIIAAVRRQVGHCIELSGGTAANTAVGVASLGGQVEFVGPVADDECGQIFRHDIRTAGAVYETPRLAAAAVETSRSLILVTPDGQRTMATFLGRGTDLRHVPIDQETVAAFKIILIEGYLLDQPDAVVTCQGILSTARRSGTRIALSLPDTPCINKHRNALQNLIRMGIDVLIANEHEFKELYEPRGFNDALSYIRNNVELVAITQSGRGSLIVSRGKCTHVPALPIRKIVDMTGAGDFFAAGLLYGLTNGMDPITAANLGSFAASEVISTFGPRPQVKLSNLARLRGLMH